MGNLVLFCQLLALVCWLAAAFSVSCPSKERPWINLIALGLFLWFGSGLLTLLQ